MTCPGRWAHRHVWLMHAAAMATRREAVHRRRDATMSLAAWMATRPVARRLEPCLSRSTLCCVVGAWLRAWTCRLACLAHPMDAATCPTSGDTLYGREPQLSGSRWFGWCRSVLLNGTGRKCDQMGMVPEHIAQRRKRRVARHCLAGVRQWAHGGGLLCIILESWGVWMRLRPTGTVAGA